VDNRIRELRESKGMTQLRLSLELGVTQETISAYETGKHNISMKTLIQMSEIFNASLDYIMARSNSRENIRKSDLTVQEIEIISGFRNLSHIKQEKLISYLEGLRS